MRKFSFVTTALLGLLAFAPAQAATVLHLSNTGGVETVPNDPVFLTSSTQFFVDNVSGQAAAGPTTLYFLTATGVAPIISSISLHAEPGNVISNVTFGAVTDTGFNLTAGTDLYSLVNNGGNNSISYANVSLAFNAQFGSTPASFDIYSVLLSTGITGQDYLEVNGNFAAGTIIAPYIAPDLYTSWTNTGVVQAVPESTTWAMMLIGFAGVGLMAYRRRQVGAAFRVA